MEARIVKGMGGTYYAYTDQIVEVIPTGKIRKSKLLIGDRVEIQKDAYSSKYIVCNILPRKNELVRPKVANIDQLMIVIAALPQPDFYLVDKLIITCQINHIDPILIVNKTDLAIQQEIAKVYGKILPIYYVSAKDGSGLEKVKECMKHKVTAFAGQSAVGKSTLISALFQMSLDTGSLSKKVERGKHTTRHTELFHVGEDIWVMDTPGFSLYELNQILSQELQNYYPEFASYKQSCKFSNCVHTTQNANVCGVVQAVQEGKIDMGRYQRYVAMFHAMQQKEQQF